MEMVQPIPTRALSHTRGLSMRTHLCIQFRLPNFNDIVGPNFQRLDHNALHRINRYPVYKC